MVVRLYEIAGACSGLYGQSFSFTRSAVHTLQLRDFEWFRPEDSLSLRLQSSPCVLERSA